MPPCCQNICRVFSIHYIRILSSAAVGCYEDCDKMHSVHNMTCSPCSTFRIFDLAVAHDRLMMCLKTVPCFPFPMGDKIHSIFVCGLFAYILPTVQKMN
jgi:hypothetical protein